MDEIELRLVANNKDAVKGIREVGAESQKLYANNEKSIKREKGLIQDIEDELTKMKEAKKRAYTTGDIEKLNRKIKEAELNLEDYNRAGLKAEKQTATLSQTIGKWVLGLGGATAALGILKTAILATTTGINMFNIVGAASKQVLANLVSGTGALTKGLGQAIAAQQELNRLRLQDKIDTYYARIEMLKFNNVLIQAKDQTKSATERIKSYDEAIAHKSKSTQIEIKSTQDQLKAYQDILRVNRDDENAKMKIIELKTRIIDLMVNEKSAMKEIESMRSGLLQQGIKEQEDQMNRIHELGLKLGDAYIKDEEDRAKERLAIEEKLQKEIATLIWQNQKDRQKFGTDTWEGLVKQEETQSKLMTKVWTLLGLEQKNLGLQVNKDILDANIKGSKAAEKWDSEERERIVERGKKNRETLKAGLEELLKFTQTIADKQMEDAERHRELLDTRISETQQALNTEVELYKAGYASNVTAKRKELEELKKQRDKALKDEEEAIKKQRAMESIAQGINIFTSTTQILKGATKLGPIGVAIAAAAITAMFGIIASSRKKAAASGFAKGGWTGDGGNVDSTGERVAGIVHEREYVVRKGPAHKFREVLEAINRDDKKSIFNSFNKLSPELLGGTTINNVVVQNDGPNKRLDEVNSHLKRLNMKEDVMQMGNMTVYKRGNNIRTIRK
ncbi:MAG: hypothetical protein IMZ64_04670 [Bacteroidetes bacterium]|nr:hypothetical protein [Bacteroidota bacterium]